MSLLQVSGSVLSPERLFLVTCLLLVVVKYCIGLYPHSGQGTPPIFGDYEAQRHWMELTAHLPVTEWYRYDLQYWGLDYPPLTALHSLVLGKLCVPADRLSKRRFTTTAPIWHATDCTSFVQSGSPSMHPVV